MFPYDIYTCRQIGLKCNLDMLDKEETMKQLSQVQKASAPQPGGLRSNRSVYDFNFVKHKLYNILFCLLHFFFFLSLKNIFMI